MRLIMHIASLATSLNILRGDATIITQEPTQVLTYFERNSVLL